MFDSEMNEEGYEAELSVDLLAHGARVYAAFLEQRLLLLGIHTDFTAQLTLAKAQALADTLTQISTEGENDYETGPSNPEDNSSN